MFKYLKVAHISAKKEVFHITSKGKLDLPKDVEICGFYPDQCVNDTILKGVLETEDLVVVKGTAVVVAEFPVDTYTDYNCFNGAVVGARYVELEQIAWKYRLVDLYHKFRENMYDSLVEAMYGWLNAGTLELQTRDLLKKYAAQDKQYFFSRGSLPVVNDELSTLIKDFIDSKGQLQTEFIINCVDRLNRRQRNIMRDYETYNEVIFKNMSIEEVMSTEECRVRYF